jgi:nicotinate phosphoribosyltransferase
VLAGKLYDIPVRGTHAHSWVTAFDDEMSSFEAYAEVMPHNCVLLVDTYDTIQGVKNAIKIGEKLRKNGGELRGVRLDSGNLAELSIKARELLDAAGFTQTRIIASNSLDEYVIEDLKKQGAQISIWGVGTNLTTAYDHPALDGVYKLSAVRDENGKWQYKLKLSEQAVKVSNPGVHQVRRFFRRGISVMDVMYDVELGIPESPEVLSLDSPHVTAQIAEYDACADLLVPVFRGGELVYQSESIHTVRDRSLQQVAQFVKTQGDKTYFVGLEKKLHDVKQQLIAEVSVK